MPFYLPNPDPRADQYYPWPGARPPEYYPPGSYPRQREEGFYPQRLNMWSSPDYPPGSYPRQREEGFYPQRPNMWSNPGYYPPGSYPGQREEGFYPQRQRPDMWGNLNQMMSQVGNITQGINAFSSIFSSFRPRN